MKTTPVFFIVFILIFILIFILMIQSSIKPAVAAQSKTAETFDSFTIYIENDYFAGTDYGYTGGFQLTWSTPFQLKRTDYRLPEWTDSLIRRLPVINDPDRRNAVSFSLGQTVYTPEDIEENRLIRDDRPYAGISYLSTAIHSKTDRQKYSLKLDLGIVGPHSYAGDFQDWGHKVTGSERPNGWKNQLEDEFMFQAICDTLWRAVQGDLNRHLNYDIIPHIGGRIGNMAVYANAGAELRIGWNLPSNFGTCPISAGCETNSAFEGRNSENFDFKGNNRPSFHFFISCDGRAVLHDITLDGNTFRASHSVDKEILVADIMAGFAFSKGNFKFAYSYIYRTKQFKTQDYDTIFGSLSASFFF